MVAEVLPELITSCEQLLRDRGWTNALDELRRGDSEFRESHWVNAVGEYYVATESALKYRLTEAGVEYFANSWSARPQHGSQPERLIPGTTSSCSGSSTSIRSPRRHGQGPDPQTVDVGQAEALLMGNHARSLIVYLGHHPD